MSALYASLALNVVLIVATGVVWGLWRDSVRALKQADAALDKCREIVAKLEELEDR